MLYRTAGYLQYLAGLKPKDKIAGVFGSFGWSSGATKQMTARLEEIGFEMPEPTSPEVQADRRGHRGRAGVGRDVRRARQSEGHRRAGLAVQRSPALPAHQLFDGRREP